MSHMIRRLILFAPGAGAPSSHPWMQNWKQRLSDIGVAETFDYDYMRAAWFVLAIRFAPWAIAQKFATKFCAR